MKILAVIPARSGSKRIENKNTRAMCGRPLLAWSVQHALEAASVDRVVVSTDDPEIATLARTHGAETPFIRPAALADDSVPTRAVEDHALDFFHGLWDPDALVTLHPTSPLRLPDDIDACVSLLSNCTQVRSVVEPDRHPWHMWRRIGGQLEPYADDRRPVPSQQFPDVVADNGAVWARWNPYLYGAPKSPVVRGYEMPPERSVDVDTEFDWRIAEHLLRMRELERKVMDGIEEVA